VEHTGFYDSTDKGSESAASFFEVIFEEPLMKLVQDVRRDTQEDVSIREICPEWQENRTKALSNELGWILTSGLSMEGWFGLCLIA